MDDITGVGAIEGALMRISTELVVQRTNASGGVNGHPIQVVYVDPKGDANQALQFAQQLAQQDNVDVLAGGLFSPECLGVQNLVSNFQIVYVPLNGCASDALTTKSCDKYTFRVYAAGRQTSDPRSAMRSRRSATSGASSIPITPWASPPWRPARPRLQNNGA